MNSPNAIQVKALYKTFQQKVIVDHIHFNVPKGICFGILGPNGAGKTTTIRMLLGLSPMTAGEITLLDMNMPKQGRQIRARLGLVPQLDNLDPDFTVFENLLVYGNYFNISHKILKPRIAELLDFVELTKQQHQKIDTLSGGMKRRLTIARALVNDPDVIILDEPTTGLDPQVRHLLWSRLRALRQQGKTLVLTTHYMDEAERLCDNLVIMDHGKILVQDSPKNLIKQHVSPFVLEIEASVSQLKKIIDNNILENTLIEEVDNRCYCYTQSLDSLVENLKPHPEIIYYHRPANLEDVFLKLTGRNLRG